jgi:hypothetical protein
MGISPPAVMSGLESEKEVCDVSTTVVDGVVAGALVLVTRLSDVCVEQPTAARLNTTTAAIVHFIHKNLWHFSVAGGCL